MVRECSLLANRKLSMNIGISGRVHGMLLKDSQNKVIENLGKEYVQYDDTDTGYMLTQYDSNVTTEWKKGAGVLPLNQVEERVTAVIKDIPFKVKANTSCTGSGVGGK